MMKLNFRESGTGQPMVIMHGIFGSSDNWMPQAKLFSEHYRVFSLDLRNHGQSPHDDQFDYPVMVEDLRSFVDDHGLDNPVVIGHSMGGKVAMNYALAHPEKIARLVVVDIAPRPYNLDHYVILDGLKAIAIDTVSSRQEADDALSAFVPELAVRQFLLKNLQRKPEGGFSWKLNLPVIDRNLPNIGLGLQYSGTFEKPTLFVRGTKSPYIRDKDEQYIRTYFPGAVIKEMDTGHWVQAEKPAEFVELVQTWLNEQA